MTDTAASVLEYVRKHPACTCEQVAKALGISTRRAGVELRELRDAGRVASAGNTRGVKYTSTPDV